jgi:hypothetical protein
MQRPYAWLFGVLAALFAGPFLVTSCGRSDLGLDVRSTSTVGTAGTGIGGAGGTGTGFGGIGTGFGGNNLGGTGVGGELACSPVGASCTEPSQCCDGICSGGVCAPCGPVGSACSDDSQCCFSLCDDDAGVCVPNPTCEPLGAACDGEQANCCSGFCTPLNVCGTPSCGHDVCTPGAPLSETCSACVDMVCSEQPSCCSTGWNGLCVSLANVTCGAGCAACLPDGDACAPNGPPCCDGSCFEGTCTSACTPAGTPCDFDAGTDTCCPGSVCGGVICVPTTCTEDGGACMVGAECCDGQCNGGICGGETCLPAGSFCGSDGGFSACCEGTVCSEEICLPEMCIPDGIPCNPGMPCCSTCTGGICGGVPMCTPDGELCSPDQPCCSGPCSVSGFCGDTCDGGCPPVCTANGGACVKFSDCCSGTCANGTCEAACQDNGTPCMTAAQCCSAECNGGLCGPPTCPSDGTACGDCIASSCCAQASACLSNPACDMTLECLIGCVGMGGQPAQCFGKCGGNPMAIQAALCAAQSCAGACL